VRLLEVVDVTPITRGRLGCRLFFEEPANDRVLAGARRSEREQVVPVTAHANAELNRRDRTILAEFNGLSGSSAVVVKPSRVGSQRLRNCEAFNAAETVGRASTLGASRWFSSYHWYRDKPTARRPGSVPGQSTYRPIRRTCFDMVTDSWHRVRLLSSQLRSGLRDRSFR
jgi:hypothetical protein